MVDMPLPEALDAFDAMIGALQIDDSNPVPIELDNIADSGDAMVGAAIVADGTIEGSAIEVEGSSNAAISIEPNLATGIGAADAGIASGSIPTGPAWTYS